MKHPRSIHGSLTKVALLIGLGIGGATFASPQIVDAKPKFDFGKFDCSKIAAEPVRLRMELEVKKTTDSNENNLPLSSNTEDEVYYSIAGLHVIDGQTTTLGRKEIRPNNPSKDVWEMGPNSNDVLHRSLYEHKIKMCDRAAFTLVISEQDNAQLKEIEQLIKDTIKLAVTAIAQEVGADHFLGTGEFDDKKALDTLISDTKAILGALDDNHDQPIGVVEISMSGATVKVKGVGSSVKEISSTFKKTEHELTGFGSKYRLRIWVEDGSKPAPKHRVFLDRSKDQCGEDKLWVESKNGNVLLKKGESKDVYVKSDRYTWHCGDLDENDSSNAPDSTNLAVTTRAASGREIRWEWFEERTAVADFK